MNHKSVHNQTKQRKHLTKNKLMFKKSTAFLFLIATFLSNANAQETLKEKEYTVSYFPSTIEISFDREYTVKAYNSRTQEEKISIRDGTNNHKFVITDVHPSEFITLQYGQAGGEESSFKTLNLAAKSFSSGITNVYFNHTVDTSVAQYQPAQNLGSNLDDKLITYIDACQSTLDIAIYNSYSPSSTTGIAGAINNAFNRGVTVRVIYDGSTGSTMIPLLNPAIPTLPSPTGSAYGIMHNKFVVFDATSSSPNIPWVWTGSTNWTADQIDGPDKNNAIAIQDQALALAYKTEFEEMWGSTLSQPNLANSKFGPYKTNNTPHNFVIGGNIVTNYFSPSDGVTSQIINVVNSANTDIEIATMLITRDDIRDAIITKHNSGIAPIYGVFDTQNPSGNDIPALKTSVGSTNIVQYAGTGVMHHKFLVVDNFNASSDPTVLTGSHNWSTSAETKNDENTLIIHSKEVADQYYQAFHYLYSLAGGILATAENKLETSDVLLYPNPTDGNVSVKLGSASTYSKASIMVYSVLGSKVLEKEFTYPQSITFNLSNLVAGLYFVTLSVDGKSYQSKIILK